MPLNDTVVDKAAGVLFAYVVTGDEKEAKRIGRGLVQERLAACVNIFPGMRSVYRWKGAVEEDEECAMLLKISRKNAQEVVERIRELHSYELPCIVMLPLAYGLEGFLDFIVNETGTK